MGLLPGWHWKAKTHVKKPDGNGDIDEETRRLVDEVIQEEAEAGDL